MRILGISGSPRKGNSDYLLAQALDAGAEAAGPDVVVDYWSVRGKKLRPCTACFRCADLGGECSIADDFQAARDLWVAADVVIYAVPVYHMGIPGQLKCFIDRLGNSLFARYAGLFPPGTESLPKHLKVIAGIAQGIHIFSGQEATLTQLVNHALLMQCVPSSGDMWQCYIGREHGHRMRSIATRWRIKWREASSMLRQPSRPPGMWVDEQWRRRGS